MSRISHLSMHQPASAVSLARSGTDDRPARHKWRVWVDVLCWVFFAWTLSGCALGHGAHERNRAPDTAATSTPQRSGVQVYGEVDVSVGWTAGRR